MIGAICLGTHALTAELRIIGGCNFLVSAHLRSALWRHWVVDDITGTCLSVTNIHWQLSVQPNDTWSIPAGYQLSVTVECLSVRDVNSRVLAKRYNCIAITCCLLAVAFSRSTALGQGAIAPLQTSALLPKFDELKSSAYRCREERSVASKMRFWFT